MGQLAYGWVGLLSGNDWMAAKDIHRRIRTEFIAKGPPRDLSHLHRLLGRCGKAYIKSPLNNKYQVEIIVTGFIGKLPVIAVLGLSDSDTPTIIFHPSYATVGSGSQIAGTFLNIRDCKPDDELERAVYVVYEAKKYSEKASGVGPETAMGVMAPMPLGSRPDQIMILEFSDSACEELEGYRTKNGIQKLEHLPLWIGMPALSPATPLNRQHLTTDPSGQTRSPG
jgi:hypothetical protein